MDGIYVQYVSQSNQIVAECDLNISSVGQEPCAPDFQVVLAGGVVFEPTFSYFGGGRVGYKE